MLYLFLDRTVFRGLGEEIRERDRKLRQFELLRRELEDTQSDLEASRSEVSQLQERVNSLESELEASKSRRGNCHDNAVAESFFQLLKRERNRRRTYSTRDDARHDVFEYIEMFHNPKRKHTNIGMLSPVDFEIRQRKLNEAGV